jgi:hypothetical protein
MRRIAALSICLIVLGCAAQPPKEPPLGPGEIRSAQAAKDAIVVGKSTKADARAALGDAVVIDFDSGYAVWLYRERRQEKSPGERRELVLLFAPSGIVAKTRVR